jgi:cob(I)alamin adenosyltransferase
MVFLNKVYTRTGDDGTTALGTGERRKKYDLRIAAYGTLDEVNVAIGVARLSRIQNDLFDAGVWRGFWSSPSRSLSPRGA